MLKISKLSDYAVVLLGTMAISEQERYSAANLAKITHVSEPTVSKLLKLLAKANIVASIRGAQGGYYLKHDIDSISVADVMVAIDGPLALATCVESGESNCSLKETCIVRGQWVDVNHAIYEALDKIKLSSMVRPCFLKDRECGCEGSVSE